MLIPAITCLLQLLLKNSGELFPCHNNGAHECPALANALKHRHCQ